jgi:hypothetical protein
MPLGLYPPFSVSSTSDRKLITLAASLSDVSDQIESDGGAPPRFAKKPRKPRVSRHSGHGKKSGGKERVRKDKDADIEVVYARGVDVSDDLDKELGLDDLQTPEQLASKDIDELLAAWTNPSNDGNKEQEHPRF